ncbi:MAG: VWA domain-containing protein [Lachnospiraceae bacterium]|nr:VWA domain-containing protein [Lachnospiraceae bacterium]
MKISFTEPLALIMIPIGIAIIIYASKYFRTVKKNKKKSLIAMRITIFTLVVLALSGFSIALMSRHAYTVFLVDCSDSMKQSISDVGGFLSKQIEKMPKNNSVAVVAFGSDTKVAQFMTKEKFYAGINDKPITTATDVEGAITTALTMFPEGGGKRIVLISDGIENEGDMLSSAASISRSNVELDILPITEQITDEVYIDDLTVPETIKIGDKYAVTVKVMSNVKTEAELSLFSGRELKDQEHVTVNVGENQYVFYDEASDKGTRNYRAEIAPYKDTATVNNEYSAFAEVDTKDRILVIEGTSSKSDSLLAALRAGGVACDAVTPTGAPKNINDMLEYKSIILENVYYDDLKEGFVNNIDSYVKNYAGGLVVVGGEDSYALGGYRNTVLEDILPVELDPEGQNNIPKMAFYMVIDHSGSMSAAASDGSPYKAIDLAKAAAEKSLDSLRDTDEVGVLAFDDSYDWVVPPTVLNDRDKVSEGIGSITINGGTSIYPAVAEAVSKIKKSDSQLKHIVLLTDGEDGFRQYADLLKDIKDNNITLSTVAIGAESDTGIMKYLANEGGGRYYYTDANKGLPRIFAKEVYLAVGEYLINEEFSPVLASNDDCIKALEEGSPTLYGYVATSIKATAKEHLKTGRGDPLLASWQYGLGHVYAWTSDGEGKWTSNFASWDKYPEFWRNIIDASISNTDLDGDIVKAEQKGSKGIISYETKDYSNDTKINAIVTDEEGNETEVKLNPTSPGHYEATIDTSEVGVYNIAVTNSDKNGIVKSANTATAMQYSPEYRFYEDTGAMDKLVTLTSGIKLSYDSDVFKKMPNKAPKDKNLSDLLLLLALILFIYDVVARRLNISIIDSLIKRKNKDKLAYETNSYSVDSNEAITASNTDFKDSLKAAIKEEKLAAKNLKKDKISKENAEENNQNSDSDSDKKTKESKKNKKAKNTKENDNKPKALDTNALLKKQRERNSR